MSEEAELLKQALDIIEGLFYGYEETWPNAPSVVEKIELYLSKIDKGNKDESKTTNIN